MADRIQFRRDTSSNWQSVNPVLAQGEIGHETDTDFIKVGNGTDAWNSLLHINNPSANVSQSGSNSNGDWIQWPDGTMMCNSKIVVNFVDSTVLSGTWVFPKAFVGNVPYIQATVIDDAADTGTSVGNLSDAGPKTSGNGSAPITLSSVQIGVTTWSGFSSSGFAEVFVQAIGKWQ